MHSGLLRLTRQDISLFKLNIPPACESLVLLYETLNEDLRNTAVFPNRISAVLSQGNWVNASLFCTTHNVVVSCYKETRVYAF